jgi:nitroimidazol reductase NimA-like FMN-containing flavoprotein (pyridoxamine 5'-phosphate oxidase superfamily)
MDDPTIEGGRVNDDADWAARGRAIIDANLYMVLGTADRDGSPWAAPVYFAPLAYREFFWVSKPGARHSLNLAERPEISIVIFDSSVPISTGQAVYFSATAEEVGVDRRAAALEVFSRRTVSHGGREFSEEDVVNGARLRLYRAAATEQFVLDPNDERIPVSL